MNHSDLLALGERTQAMLDALAAISAEPDRLTRLYLTPEHKQAAEFVADWMRQAGMSVRMDAAAGIHGVLSAGPIGTNPQRRLLLGSHIDTVIDGGRYDGTLGVVAAIIAAAEIRSRDVLLPFDLEVIGFGDEEGVRFPTTLIGSSAIAGSIEPSILEITDSDGETVRDALMKFGCDPAALCAEAYRRDDVVGYLEVHIEQGPRLERCDEPVGVVSAIAAQSRHRVTVTGEAGHAGTVPMALRKDALVGAAELITSVEELARAGEADSLVITVGDITVEPGAVNVIPATARLSLDVRAAVDEARAAAVEAILARSRQISERRGLVIDVETFHQKAAVQCASRLSDAIGVSIGALTGRKPMTLVSGAGHDGLAMAHLTDIGMIFVRCREGISHSPLEHVALTDLGYAVECLIGAIVELARQEGG